MPGDHDIYVAPAQIRRFNLKTGDETLSFLEKRNEQIYSEYLEGCSITQLSAKYYLVEKSIQRIIRQKKKK